MVAAIAVAVAMIASVSPVSGASVSAPSGGPTTADGAVLGVLNAGDPHAAYWAYAQRRAPVRARPAIASPAFTALNLSTELGAPAVYLALERQIDADGTPWLKISVPMRPNGKVGWVPEAALGSLHISYTRLLIDLRARRAKLFESGVKIWAAPVGVGRRATPTPKGEFYIRESLRLGRSNGPYGSFAFGTSAYSNRLTDWPGGGVVGIHGTDQPAVIPGAVSHGCIRMRNGDVSQLHQLMGVGATVWIR